jgi:hypothetical protein
MDVESIIKVGIIEIILCELCSPQKIIIDEWLLPSISKVAFSINSTRSLVVL